MILSRKHKFLFIKTKKTAGTSVEIALSAACGDDDIITPISPNDEILRFQRTGMTAQNFSRNREAEERYRDLIRSNDLERLERERRDLLHEAPFYNHMSYSEVASLMGGDTLEDYFCFSIERYPHERILSYLRYRWSRKNTPPPSRLVQMFFVFVLATRKSFRNEHLYFDGKKFSIDFLIRYHYLSNDFKEAMSRIGIIETPELPLTKETKSGKRTSVTRLGPAERLWLRFWNRNEYTAIRSWQKLRSGA